MLDRTVDNTVIADSEEFAALARMIVYALQTSKALNSQMTSYCLDLALSAAMDEMERAGFDTSIMAPSARVSVEELH